MNFDFWDRRSAERFAELLDESTGGRRHHSRGPADEQLAELVAIGHSLSAAKPEVRTDPEFRDGLRAMLVATAERDGMGRTAPAAEPEPVAAGRSGLRAGVFGLAGRRIRARGAIVIGVAAGAMAVSGISAASENASPGDALYGVKRSTERAQLAMAGSDVSRGQLSLDFARTRLAEAAAMTGNDAGFAGVLDDMDADTRKGVKLLTTASVARRDVKPLATVDDFAARQRQTLSPVLEKLSVPNRERAATSLSLLDSVHDRAADLRTGLACTPVAMSGSDVLGPKLRDCTANADAPSTSRSHGSSGKASGKPSGEDQKSTKEPRPERTTPKPGASSKSTKAPASPDTVGPGLGTLGGTPVPTELPELPDVPGTTDTQDSEKGVLGGLLGGIF